MPSKTSDQDKPAPAGPAQVDQGKSAQQGTNPAPFRTTQEPGQVSGTISKPGATVPGVTPPAGSQQGGGKGKGGKGSSR